MDWTWDDRKAASNKAKHGVSFATAAAALDSMHYLSVDDRHSDNDRWQTLAMLDGTVLHVTHTEPQDDAPGRIISARLATRAERRMYERQAAISRS